jgi:hypothetical protein
MFVATGKLKVLSSVRSEMSERIAGDNLPQ